jgi:hypothetical protein
MQFLTQGIEALPHPQNSREQLGVDQCSHGFAVFVDDDAFAAVLHQVQHFAEVLPEVDCADIGDHGGSSDVDWGWICPIACNRIRYGAKIDLF